MILTYEQYHSLRTIGDNIAKITSILEPITLHGDIVCITRELDRDILTIVPFFNYTMPIKVQIFFYRDYADDLFPKIKPLMSIKIPVSIFAVYDYNDDKTDDDDYNKENFTFWIDGKRSNEIEISETTVHPVQYCTGCEQFTILQDEKQISCCEFNKAEKEITYNPSEYIATNGL